MDKSKSRIELLKEYLAEEPDDVFTQYALALEYARLEQNEESILLLEQLINLDPDYLPTYYQLGKLYEADGKTAQATATYEKGMEIAKKQKNMKTLNELRSALDLLQEEED